MEAEGGGWRVDGGAVEVEVLGMKPFFALAYLPAGCRSGLMPHRPQRHMVLLEESQKHNQDLAISFSLRGAVEMHTLCAAVDSS